MNSEPITEKQLATLRSFGDRLERLTKAEAQFLIGFLLGPPPGMTRGQQMLIYGRVARMDRDQVRELISGLVAQREG